MYIAVAKDNVFKVLYLQYATVTFLSLDNQSGGQGLNIFFKGKIRVFNNI